VRNLKFIRFLNKEKEKSHFCKVRRIFFWRERKRNEMKVAEEYRWAISEATGLSFCGR